MGLNLLEFMLVGAGPGIAQAGGREGRPGMKSRGTDPGVGPPWNFSRRMFLETLLVIKWMLWLDTTALGILVQTCEDAARNEIQAWGWTPLQFVPVGAGRGLPGQHGQLAGKTGPE